MLLMMVMMITMIMIIPDLNNSKPNQPSNQAATVLSSSSQQEMHAPNNLISNQLEDEQWIQLTIHSFQYNGGGVQTETIHTVNNIPFLFFNIMNLLLISYC